MELNLNVTKETGCCTKGSSRIKTIVFGLMVVALGILLVFKNMELLSPLASRIIFSWQMLLIAIGFINIFGRSGRLFGLILMAVGGFFIMPYFFDLPYNFTRTFWPLLVIIAGILIIFFSLRKFKNIGHSRKSVSDDTIEDVLVFGGSERMVTSENFKGGETVNIFSGSSYNLTQCKLAPGKNVLEVVCVFGGTKIIVPSDWNIKLEVAAVLGAFEDKRTISNTNINDENTLIIKGVTVFGGGEILSY